MSNYRMERGWMEHPVFGLFEAGIPKRPLTEQEAFIWLIENAAWKKITINICGKPVEIERGQLSYSYRFMSDKTGWSINRYKGWLKKLETWGILTLKTDTAQSIITICNYAKYQDVQKKSDTAPDTASDTPPDTAPDTKKKEINKPEERKSKKEEEVFLLPDWLSPDDWKDFSEMRNKIKKPLVGRASKSIVKKLETFRAQGHDPAAVLEQSILNCWQDVYPIKNKNGENFNATGTHHRTANNAIATQAQGGQRHHAKTSYMDKMQHAADVALATIQARVEAERDAPWNREPAEAGGHHRQLSAERSEKPAGNLEAPRE